MSGILAGLIGSFKAGMSWAVGTVTNQVFNDAVYAPLTNGNYFAFGYSSTGSATTAYQYSTNGTSWTGGTLPVSGFWRAAASSGSRIIVFRASAANGQYSDNGTTWTLTGSLPASASPTQLIWDGTRFIATAGSSASVYYSTNGASWASASTGVTGSAAGIGFDGTSRYIVTSTTNPTTNARTTTTFPTSWSSITMPSSGVWVSPVYGNGIWVVGRAGDSLYGTSTNGTTWTSRTLPSILSNLTGDLFVKLAFDNGKFYYYYLDNVYSSTDGINWTTEATVTGGTLDIVNGWAINGTKILAFGYDSPSLGATSYLNGSK